MKRYSTQKFRKDYRTVYKQYLNRILNRDGNNLMKSSIVHRLELSQSSGESKVCWIRFSVRCYLDGNLHGPGLSFPIEELDWIVSVLSDENIRKGGVLVRTQRYRIIDVRIEEGCGCSLSVTNEINGTTKAITMCENTKNAFLDKVSCVYLPKMLNMCTSNNVDTIINDVKNIVNAC